MQGAVAVVSTVPEQTAAWFHAGAACVVWRCSNATAPQKQEQQVCCNISGIFFFLIFFFIGFQEMGWRQRFPPEHA